ncbi:DNA phosphorothioation-associated DGQHR protein 1 [Litorivivens lipolytica]|uniref:DNA phosphorothioation-associated DGQHR protein 1 n=1 Tax=Litorivivens lipolytica TaxID=1524264 RepID=A0A7W4W4U6_9GAMM|nr:DGQHR domain-containing protein [Litorivivens lipolytica]MBB3047424.1 DNA phosphorothioation-associated DGQHR protein 1 [Litorivivens lipolytica]
MTGHYEFKAIKVNQPFSDYYICSIPSHLLKEISFSLKAVNNRGEVQGVQRTLNPKRLKEIGLFIDSDSAAFPNSIILGANFMPNGRYADPENKVEFVQTDDNAYTIKVPKGSKLLSIIDGQHRLYGFDHATTQMDLSCSIYEDLAMPYQAFLFSTINYTQGKVDKSLAYQLFGYEIDSSEPIEWPPETLAVHFVRKLNQRKPLLGRVKYRTADEMHLDAAQRKELPPWRLSTAAIVEAILSLLSRDPKRDRYEMNTKSASGGSIEGRSVLKDDKEYPLRKFYIEGNDKAIEDVLNLALEATNEIFWEDSQPDNFLTKTVGIACIFKYLRQVLRVHGASQKTMKETFPELLRSIKATEDFNDSNTYPASTKGLSAALKRMIDLSNLPEPSKNKT